MKKSIAFALVVGCLGVSTTVPVCAESSNPLKEQSGHVGPGFAGTLDVGRQVGSAIDGPMTIQYDTGTFTGVGNIPAIADNFSFGNVFGPVALPFTVTDLSIFMALVDGGTTGTGNAFVTVFDALNTAGTNAAPLTSPQVALSANAFNNVAVTVTFTGTGSSTFLAGVWNPTAGNTGGPTPCGIDCVGFDTNNGGNGFHGFALEDLNGGNFTQIPNANALYRVSGPGLPVELMTFSLEE